MITIGNNLDYAKEENEKELRILIEKYDDLPAEQGIMDLIIQAYRLEKPLTGVEIFEKDPRRVESFINGLQDFFFVEVYRDEEDYKEEFNGEVYLSRFQTLVEVAVGYDKLSDEVADLAGILFGYNPREVYEYCQEQRNRKNGSINTNLIK